MPIHNEKHLVWKPKIVASVKETNLVSKHCHSCLEPFTRNEDQSHWKEI